MSRFIWKCHFTLKTRWIFFSFSEFTGKNLRVNSLHISETNNLCDSIWTLSSTYLRTNPVLFLILSDSVLTSCRLLHLSFTSERTNKRLPKSLTHMKVSGRCWFPYSIRGQIEKEAREGPLWKTTEGGRKSAEHVYPRASDDKWKTSSNENKSES